MQEKLNLNTSNDFSAAVANWLPGGRHVGVLLPQPEEEYLASIKNQLLAEGVDISNDFGWFRLQFADAAMLNQLKNTEQHTGITASEFVKHSFRFFTLNPDSIVTGRAVIPRGPENLLLDGRHRRQEEGGVIDLQKVREQNVDPAKVLFYRVTQPSDTPKPEYYWTSDSVEVRGGLTFELGSHAETAVVLVSTLENIAQNGGLIEDLNDALGIAVRQIGPESFDQSQALFLFPREFET